MIRGTTEVIAHIGYPTAAFRAPMIYNPYFEELGVDVVVVPMGCRADAYPDFLRALFRLENIRGALVTMPHKVSTVALLDECSTAVRIAGSCNAVRRSSEGRLQGDMFDGEGFVGGLRRNNVDPRGTNALIVGSGGVGSAIAASLARAGARRLALFDVRSDATDGLAERLKTHYPTLEIATGSNDPAGFDVVVNATTLGTNEDDPLPVDISRLDPRSFAGEVVMKKEITPFLSAARARGCRFQVGAEMLFEMIPAYLEYFGLPVATSDHLRQVARLSY